MNCLVNICICNTAAKRLRMRTFVAVIRASVPGSALAVPTTTSHRRLNKTQFKHSSLLFKKGYEDYEGGISEYVTMLTTKPCMDGVLVIWKIKCDSLSNINNSVIYRSFLSCEH